ncbi:hypothetical protein KW846_03405 [Pseudomonas sp. PDM32]|uniref:hypothetical protein n=1 Tax=Pseudomonas sp. PDM32 TaxID=2854768 RepID=UPI001C4551BF|nr:hypothetical protein [Pseudomonas sp. PDM32]MBV7571740.1 hypothetical protein [Pseudomonas sp. PDM32]
MKLQIMCMECHKELSHPGFEFITTDYYEEAVGYITCSRGHKSAIVLQSLKFEILLESAAKALLHGYTLEAASSLSSAYERAIEFAILVLSRKLGIDSSLFTLTYKQMAKQSERQIGAFLAMYSAVFKSEFNLSTKIPPKRNEIIHQGKILNPTEVIQFGELVYAEIKLITDKLRTLDNDLMRDIIFETVNSRHLNLPSDLPRATTTGTTFFDLSRTDNPDTFFEALERLEEAERVFAEAQPHLDLLAATLLALRPPTDK